VKIQRSLKVPIGQKMEWKTEMEAACSALGTFDGNKYYKEDDCLECIKDLIRYLRRDDDNFTLRRGLGQIGVIKSGFSHQT